MKTNIGISEDNRQKIVALLATLLADEYVLFTKTKNAHWNIQGIDFNDKHKLFDEQAEQLQAIIDDVAERIRTLGHFTPGSLHSLLALARLTDTDISAHASPYLIQLLLTDHEAIIQYLREEIDLVANVYNDAGTSDFITGLLQVHEKTAWILRSHLS